MKRIIIFGAGTEGRNLLKKIDRNDVDFFVDNNNALSGKRIDGIKVIPFNTLMSLYDCEKHIIIISAEGFFDEIRNQLEDVGIREYVKLSHFLLEKKMTKKTKRRILLANTHMGTNIGDHLITLAELDFFEKYLSDYEIIELTASEIDERFDEIRDYISADDIIAISGGGYMGSLWPIYGEYNVRRIVSELPDNQIIIMPQSIYYDDTEEDKEQLQISRKIYLSHKRLSVCIRESDRLSYIKSLFGNKINCKAYPDMVFSMERKEYSLVRNGIGVCFRADKESVMAEEKKQEIINYLDDEVIFFDMHSDIPVIGSERSECVKKYINMIAGLRYVITDRLHCMLICMITGTPCIAFDNLTGKVSGVYQWMDESRYISVVNSVQEVVEYIGRYSGNENNKWCSWDNAYKKFEDLAKDIKIESDR